jgi:uncharacterized protein (DUF983 family)
VCGQGELFKGWLTLHDTCSVCGARYFRDPGNWTAPTAFGYGIGAVAAVLTLVVLWFVDGLQPGSEYIIIAVAVGATLATFRHVKAWWVAVLTRMGNVYPDAVATAAEPDPPASPASPPVADDVHDA